MGGCLDAILSRCSVRRFEDRPLPREVVEEVVRAGIRAPNASAAEQWFFVVVESEEKRREVYELLVEAHVYYAFRVRRDWGPGFAERWREKMLRDRVYWAPVYIAGYLDLRERVCRDEYSELERLWAVQSLSAAFENMILAAWSKGIGSVWLGVPLLMPERFNEVLGVEGEGFELMGMLAMGYPRREVKPRPRAKKLGDVVRFV